MEETIHQEFERLKKRKNWKDYNQLRALSFQEKVINTDDPEFIADYFITIEEPEQTIINLFSKESIEYLFYEMKKYERKK